MAPRRATQNARQRGDHYEQLHAAQKRILRFLSHGGPQPTAAQIDTIIKGLEFFADASRTTRSDGGSFALSEALQALSASVRWPISDPLHERSSALAANSGRTAHILLKGSSAALLLAFASAVVRSDLLHACSSQLAAVTDFTKRSLASLMLDPGLAEAVPREPLLSPLKGWTSVALGSVGNIQAAISEGGDMYKKMGFSAPQGWEGQVVQLRGQLRTALEGSCVLENAARGRLMLALEGVDAGGSGTLMHALRQCTAAMSGVAPQPMNTRLLGPCCQHLTLALALRTLHAVDGGELYGMPQEYVLGLELFVHPVAHPAYGDTRSGTVTYARDTLYPDPFWHALALLGAALENSEQQWKQQLLRLQQQVQDGAAGSCRQEHQQQRRRAGAEGEEDGQAGREQQYLLPWHNISPVQALHLSRRVARLAVQSGRFWAEHAKQAGAGSAVAGESQRPQQGEQQQQGAVSAPKMLTCQDVARVAVAAMCTSGAALECMLRKRTELLEFEERWPGAWQRQQREQQREQERTGPGEQGQRQQEQQHSGPAEQGQRQDTEALEGPGGPQPPLAAAGGQGRFGGEVARPRRRDVEGARWRLERLRLRLWTEEVQLVCQVAEHAMRWAFRTDQDGLLALSCLALPHMPPAGAWLFLLVVQM